MATNLFEAFDSAFAETRRSRATTMIAAIGGKIAAMRHRRRHAKEMRHVKELPPYLLKDVGLHSLNGRLLPIPGTTTVSASEWR